MNKKNVIVFIACFLAFFFSHNNIMAQYNRTYMSTLGSDTGSSAVDIVSLNTGSVCVLGSGAFDGQLILRTIDNAGNITLEKAYDANNGILTPTKLIYTLSHDILVVGYYYDTSALSVNPFAALFDRSLNVLWFNVYNSNLTDPILGFGSKVTATLVNDDLPIENYILACAGDTTGTGIPYNPYQDAYLNAIKIKVSTGGLVWNKKYFLQNRTTTYASSVPTSRVYANTITFVPDIEGNKYFIAGTFDEVVFTNGFMMSIDKNGSIVDGFREFDIQGYPFNVDAIYDSNAAHHSIVMAYTMGSTGIRPGTPTESTVNVTWLSESLTQIRTKLYADSIATENYPYSIRMDATQHNFIIPTFVDDNTTFPGHSFLSMALLKIDVSGNPSFFNRYSYLDTVSSSAAAVSVLDPSTTIETYVSAGTLAGSYGANNLMGLPHQNLRMISTDVSGNACQAVAFPLYTDTTSLVISQYPYITGDLTGSASLSVSTVSISSTIYDCDSLSVYSYHQPLSVTNISSSNLLRIYPTLLQNDDNELKLDATSTEPTDLSIILCSMDGKMVMSQQFKLAQGQNTIHLNLPSLVNGSYIVKGMTINGSMQRVVRITKL